MMIYLYENLANYSDEAYLKDLQSLPAWRGEKALQYKKLDDRKRSVLAFVLLQRALREEYGITEIPEFVYNEFGKPSLPNLPIHFSLSHCKDAVACAVSDHNIGIDMESIVPYNPDVARRVCSPAELEMLEKSTNKDVEFIKIWTAKEAVSKYEGMGLSLPFAEIDVSKYAVHTNIFKSKRLVLSIASDRDSKIFSQNLLTIPFDCDII